MCAHDISSIDDFKQKNKLDEMSDWDKGFSIIADLDGNEEQYMNVEMENEMPVLPLRNMVLLLPIRLMVSVWKKSLHCRRFIK